MRKREVTLTSVNSFEALETELPAESDSRDFWKQSFDLLDLWFLMRGLDPEEQRIDRSKLTCTTPPWLVPNVDNDAQDPDT